MEVMLALVVIAFGLYGILDLMAANRRLSHRAAKRAVAVELARAKMAEIRAAGIEKVAALWAKSPSPKGATFVYPPEPAKLLAPYEAETFLWQARFDRDEKQPGIVNVEVRIFWYPTAIAPVEKLQEHSVAVGGLLAEK